MLKFNNIAAFLVAALLLGACQSGPDKATLAKPEVAVAPNAEEPAAEAEVVDFYQQFYEDAVALRLNAHTLKGTIRVFGRTLPAAELALQLETMGENAELTHADDVLASLEREMPRFLAALDDYDQKK